MHVLGIDVGGSGIKGAPVNTETGELLTERFRVETPKSAKPRPIARAVNDVVKHFDWRGPIGCGFPSIVQDGVARNAANIHESWIGTNIQDLFSEATNLPVKVLNDADAAGMAEMTFGAGKGQMGVVLIVTIGTGLGSALFTNGVLVPNTEFGHIEIDGADAEQAASDAARKRLKLSWKKWGKRFDKYLTTLEYLLSPNLIILGGGAVKNLEEFSPLLTVKAKVIPAQFLNDAGIVGAALAARDMTG